MEEFTIEQKAQRYDKAIDKANELKYVSDKESLQRKTVEHIFPELAESEDERIRKELIDYFSASHATDTFRGISWDKVVAWLEKQGEKSIDKVEPKFKVGDYVVGKYISGYISEVRDDCYLLDYQGFPIDKQDDYHLWTIQDAKDGDVLFIGIDGSTCIFKKFEGNLLYSYIISDGKMLVEDSHYYYETSDNVHPATKEQRDTLEKAMADAGYTFDFKKKELKKIEYKPAEKIETRFHEGDWVVLSTSEGEKVVQIESIEYFKSGEPRYITSEDRWFGNGTKARLLTDKDVETITLPESKVIVNQKPAWSEEDERMLNHIIGLLEGLPNLHNWLKSIKDRVQPLPKQEWKQENTGDLTDFENTMMHIGESFFGQYAGLDPNDTNVIKEQANLLLELVPSKEWSEADKNRFNNLIFLVECSKENEPTKKGFIDFINRLKSLRPQNQWKPLGKHLEALAMVINDEPLDISVRDDLNELFGQLKQL